MDPNTAEEVIQPSQISSAPQSSPPYPKNGVSPRKKKIVILITGSTIVLLLGMVLFFLLYRTKTPIQRDTPSPSSPTISVKQKTVPTEIEKSSKIYLGKTFSLHYPSDWRITKAVFPDKTGESLIIRPETIPDGVYTPGLVIDITEASESASLTADRAQYIKFFSFKQSTIKVGATYEGIKVVGTIPEKEVQGKFVKTPIYMALVYVTHNGTNYTLRYSYDGILENKDFEDTFNQILTSLVFQ